MSLAAIRDMPRSPAEWSRFSFSNQDLHRQAIDAYLRKTAESSSKTTTINTVADGADAGLTGASPINTPVSSNISIPGNPQGLALYAVDPIPAHDLTGWLRRHSIMHAQIEGLLGIQSSDLTVFNPQSEAAMQAWVRAHFTQHLLIANTLGLN